MNTALPCYRKGISGRKEMERRTKQETHREIASHLASKHKLSERKLFSLLKPIALKYNKHYAAMPRQRNSEDTQESIRLGDCVHYQDCLNNHAKKNFQFSCNNCERFKAESDR